MSHGRFVNTERFNSQATASRPLLVLTTPRDAHGRGEEQIFTVPYLQSAPHAHVISAPLTSESNTEARAAPLFLLGDASTGSSLHTGDGKVRLYPPPASSSAALPVVLPEQRFIADVCSTTGTGTA
jgi:hypothetical protein